MVQTSLLAALGGQEILFILLAVLLLFGGKKIPELMSGLGKGIREFKEGKDGADVEQHETPQVAPRKPL